MNESIARHWESFSCTRCPIAAKAEQLPQELGKYATQRKGDNFG